MIAIVDRGLGEKLSSFMSGHGVKFNLLTLATGTANKKILSYLGLGETEKDVIYSCMQAGASRKILSELDDGFRMKKPGRGIAFCIPMDCIADASGTACFNDAEDNTGGMQMEDRKHELIIAVTAQGYVDEVMDVAKKHGATGGTVLRTRGVGAKEAEKFFGITIQAEKDMIFIVVKKEQREAIMQAILQEKGPTSDAKAILFSLPVTGVAGMSFQTWEERQKSGTI